MAEAHDSKLELQDLMEEGETFRESLTSVLTQADLDLSSLVRQGCFCGDVGAGREITALLPLQPRILIASEPNNDHFDSQTINRKLSLLRQQGGFELIRKDPEKALGLAAKKGQRFGLITWLNIVTDKINPARLYEFFRLAKPLLVTGGAIVASVGYRGFDKPNSSGDIDTDEVEGGKIIFRAGSSIEQLGFKVNYSFATVKEPQFAGGVFLIGTKLA